MTYIYLQDNTVLELIPEEHPAFPGIPAVSRYSQEFLRRCILAEDAACIHVGMTYDRDTGLFSVPAQPIPVEPTPEPADPPTTEEEQLRADVDYLAVMAGVAL